jgi:hypothetical protein
MRSVRLPSPASLEETLVSMTAVSYHGLHPLRKPRQQGWLREATGESIPSFPDSRLDQRPYDLTGARRVETKLRRRAGSLPR